MNQLAARTLINNGWFVLALSLVVIFAAFLLREMRNDGWYARVRNQAAIALLIYFTGEALARGWGVLLLYKLANGRDLVSTFAVEERYPIALAGALLSFVGALCCVRVFAPAQWGNVAWVSVAIVAGIVMLLTYFL